MCVDTIYIDIPLFEYPFIPNLCAKVTKITITQNYRIKLWALTLLCMLSLFKYASMNLWDFLEFISYFSILI